MDDFKKYEILHNQGIMPLETCLLAKSDGLSLAERIRMLRSIFNLSLIQAKEIEVMASTGASSLLEHQEKLANTLNQILNDSIF